MFSKPAHTKTDIHPLLQNRWSGRAFDANRAIEKEKIDALAEAARWAPSSMNAQPWRLTAIFREQMAIWTSVKECLAASNQTWADQAPMLLVIASETQFTDGKPNRWAAYDTGAAMMALSIEATHQGLMVHQMGGFNPERLRRSWPPLQLGIYWLSRPLAINCPKIKSPQRCLSANWPNVRETPQIPSGRHRRPEPFTLLAQALILWMEGPDASHEITHSPH